MGVYSISIKCMKSFCSVFGLILVCSLSQLLTACSGDTPETSEPSIINNGGNTNNGGNGNNGGGTTTFSGTGTQDDPYIIGTLSDLRKLANDVNSGTTYQDKYFKMTKDITINSNVFDSDGMLNENGKFNQWTPIGNSERTSFCGVFDGGGHTISGLYINDNKQDYLGLFGILSGVIKNLNICDSYINGHNKCGGIAGTVTIYTNDPQIINCSFRGALEGLNYGGGILGNNNGYDCKVDRCVNYGIIFMQMYAGGIVGGCNKATISNCINHGQIVATPLAGGIVGSSTTYKSDVILNCVNFGTIYSENGTSYGISGATPKTVSNCVNYGDANYGICTSVYSKSQLQNTYYLDISCKTGYKSSSWSRGDIDCKSMAGKDMQKQAFLDELNKNAKDLGANFAKWKFNKDGFPTLDI